MPTYTYKVLGQALPSAVGTETVLYTVPTSTQTIVSTITVANVTASASTYRVNVRPAGAAVTAVHALARDITIAGSTTATLTLGLSLAATDVISVQSGTASALTFHVYGTEIT